VFLRGEDEVAVELVLTEREAGDYSIRRAADPTALQKEILSGWLGKPVY
jgi:hypothetical protein